MTEACIDAAAHVKRSGSPELQAIMRVMLLILAGETVDRAAAGGREPSVALAEAMRLEREEG